MLGKPRFGFLVSAGNMNSMVNHYTVNKKRRQYRTLIRREDKMGLSPDCATVVYCNLIKQTRRYKDSPLIIGGIESWLGSVWLIMITGLIK